MERFEEKQESPALSRQLAASALALLALAGCSGPAKKSAQPKPELTFKSKLVPGCDIYSVFSQNRFRPYGTSVHTAPSKNAPYEQNSTRLFGINQVINVDGWEHTGVVAYPTNDTPIRNDIWFHVAYTDDTGKTGDWVSFAGVRGAPTGHPAGVDPHDLGPLAELKPECEIKN